MYVIRNDETKIIVIPISFSIKTLGKSSPQVEGEEKDTMIRVYEVLVGQE